MASFIPPRLLEAAIRARLGLPALQNDRPRREGLTERWKGRSRAHSQRNDNPLLEGNPRLLSAEDIRRWLLRFRSPEFRDSSGLRKIPIKSLAEFAGLNRDTLYEVMRTRRASVLVRIRLTWAIENIEAGRLRFCRDKRTQAWTWAICGPALSPPQALGNVDMVKVLRELRGTE
jgi:hypothetical protein